jgi:hypothetical protein
MNTRRRTDVISLLARLAERAGIELDEATAAALAYSIQRFPEAWRALATAVAYARAMLNLFMRLFVEGKPVRREWLLRIKRFASKYNERVARTPNLILDEMIAGVRAWTVGAPERAEELVVAAYDVRGRLKESFKLKIEG